MSAPPSDTDVAIVGAGAAGIAAARRLTDHGVSVLLIDALDRLGGRAWTIEAEGIPLDLGCGWLHSADRNPWVSIAEASGHVVDRTPAAWRVQYRNLGFPAAEQQAAGAAFEAFTRRLHDAPPPSDCARDAIDPGDPWAPYIEALSSYMNGAQLGDLSIADYLAYEDAATELNWRLPQGYGHLIADSARGVPLSLATKVAAIDHEGRGVRLDTDKGPIRARAALVTASTEVLARSAIRLPAAFDPVCHAAANVPLGLADKLYFLLPDSDALPPEQHLLGDPHRADTGSYYLRPLGRPVIECFFGGSAARALEGEGEAGMTAFARDELARLLGRPFADSLRPIASSAWAKIPSIGGSYSHARPGHADARATLATQVDDRILIAGEACSPTDFSTAHGAYRSGIDAAEALLSTLKADVA